MIFNDLITWSNHKYNGLPWRQHRTVYRTWISEVMLQQTTVYTVKSRLDDFCEKFPDIKSLAKATEEDLLAAWKGLGYYSRAKNLKKAAIFIEENHGGQFPSDINELQKIPGVGPYTASAIYSIGMNKKAIAVDANLERVLARFYGIKAEKGEKLKKELQHLFSDGKILNNVSENYRGLNEAFMDLGREVCQARNAFCDLCPISRECIAKSWESPLLTPYISPKKKVEKQELRLLRYVCVKGQKIYCYKKPKGTWLAGQYEIPTFILDKKDISIDQYPLVKVEELPSDFLKTGITKYKILNHYKKVSCKELKGIGDFELIDLSSAKEKLSTASIKILNKLDIF